MSGPEVSIVIDAGAAAQRLGKSLWSAVRTGEAAGLPFEVVIALADADAVTREVAESLDHPRLRLFPGAASTTRAAGEAAWGRTVVPMRGGDLLSPSFLPGMLARLDEGDGQTVVARPVACVAYGGAPSVRMQANLRDDPEGRARLVFACPFAPPLAASRALLVRLPPRPWTEADDWAWTLQSLGEGVRHLVADNAVHLAWTPPAPIPVLLPTPLGEPAAPLASAPAVAPASEAEVAALLYTRATQAQLLGLQADAAATAERLDDLALEAVRLRQELAEARAAEAQAHGAVERVHASTSWRLTAPLRAVVSRLRPGGGG